MDISKVIAELYSLPPGEFTAARNEHERLAREFGDKQLAATIHQLRKPSTGAWLANQLVREHPEEIQSFLDLGSAMREATTMLSGDQLRELGKQRRQLVHALMQQVRALAGAAGHKVSQDTARSLEDTLHAALADEGAADQLRAGRLTETLQGAGFPPAVGTESAERAPLATSAALATNESPEQERADRLGRAEGDEQLARVAVRTASDDQDRAQALLDQAETALQKATALASGLRANLEKAEVEQSLREREYHKSRADLESANRAGQEAARRLEDAIQRREGLSR